MLEKYLAPWGNKVPWINRVIELEEQVVSLGKALARAMADLYHLRQDFERYVDQLHKRLRKAEEKIYRPVVSCIQELGYGELRSAYDYEFKAIRVQYNFTIPDFKIRSMGPITKFDMLEMMLNNKQHIAQEMAEHIMMNFEKQMENLADE